MLTLRTLLASITLVAGLLVVGCSHAPKAQRPTGPGIGGTVIYITNTKLPDDATIEVRLSSLDREGRGEREVANAAFPKPVSMPLEFWLPYQPGLISQREAYGIEAKIVSNGRILFASGRPVPVLTRGNPKQVEVVVVPAR
ncbi:MAG TPA: YbaY family lipoprotein [Opitutaceae bacterium]|nr:YbaY family lipoprotein [Opitutaceae bacterium]